jgi:hypothetical protein
MAQAWSRAASRYSSTSRPGRAMGNGSAWPARETPEPKARPVVTCTSSSRPDITSSFTAREAALGAKIDVPTIDGTGTESGRAQLKIPPGTQTGQKLRMREKGVTSAAKDGHRGDQIVEVKIVVPKVQDERSKEILRELQKLNPEDPREAMLAEL